jgi:hypothetical protein
MTRSVVFRILGATLLCGTLLVGCSSNSSSSSTSSTASVPAGGSTPTESASTQPSSGGSSSALDGTWNGTWKDTANDTGTFSVDFAQNGSSLNGTLSISVTCLDGAKVTGQVNGSSIEFGSVQGQCQVDYKGTINGDQMSGTYDFSGAGGYGGTWKAAKA